MSPACFPPTVWLLDASLPSTGSSRVEFPGFAGTINALRLPAAHLAALRFLRLAIPWEHSRFRSPRRRVLRRRAWGWSPGRPGRDSFHGDDRISHVPGEPIVPMPCSSTPAGSACQAVTTRRRGPRSDHDEGSHTATFEAQSHSFSTGCLRFAGWVTPPPRKTRFRLPARLYRTGFPPAGFQKRFQTHVMCAILLFQAFVAQGQCVDGRGS